MTIRGVLRWSPFFAWCALIFFLSAQSSLPAVGPEVPGIDKVEHAVAYLAGGFLFSAAVRGTWRRLGPAAAIFLAVAAGILYGASDELHQSFVPNREAELGDLGADAAGALLGGLAHAAWAAFRRRPSRPASPPGPPAGGPSGACGSSPV